MSGVDSASKRCALFQSQARGVEFSRQFLAPRCKNIPKFANSAGGFAILARPGFLKTLLSLQRAAFDGSPMTLEEFRVQVLNALQTCPTVGDTRVFLTQTYLTLMDRRFNDTQRRKFWEALHADVGHLIPPSPDPSASHASRSDGSDERWRIYAVALSEIAHYHQHVSESNGR